MIDHIQAVSRVTSPEVDVCLHVLRRDCVPCCVLVKVESEVSAARLCVVRALALFWVQLGQMDVQGQRQRQCWRQDFPVSRFAGPMATC